MTFSDMTKLGFSILTEDRWNGKYIQIRKEDVAFQYILSRREMRESQLSPAMQEHRICIVALEFFGRYEEEHK